MAMNQQAGGMLARTGAMPPEQPMGQQPMEQEPVEQGQEPQGFVESEADGAEQDQYDRVVMAGMKIMFDNDKTRDKIEKRLEADKGNPAKTLSDTAAMIMVQLDQQTGGEIAETVVLPAATEILEQLSEFADSLGMFEIDDAVLNRAGQLLVENLSEQYGVGPEDAQALMASFSPEQLKQVEEEQGNFARKQPPIA